MVFWWIIGILAVGAAGYYLVLPAFGAIALWFAALSFGWLFTLFAIGTAGFWVLLVLESGLMCFYLIDDSDDGESVGFGATISIVVTIALLGFLGNLFSLLLSNLLFLASAVAGYLFAGTVYMCVRIYFFSREASDAFQGLVDKFCEREKVKEKNVLANPDKLREMREFISTARRSPAQRLNLDRGKVLVREHKARIMTWLMFWPWSLVWWAFHDLITKIFEEIYRLMSTQLQRIADYGVRDINKYFPQEKNDNPPPAEPANGGADVKSEAETVKIKHDPTNRNAF